MNYEWTEGKNRDRIKRTVKDIHFVGKEGQSVTFLKNFAKGIIAGIGGVAPGLSGSVLLVIMGLYEQMVHAIGTLFRDFKKNILFLLPLVAGMGVGVLLFSQVADYLLNHYEFQTRYAFLGLILGTIPLFYREVQKKGFKKRYYLLIVAAAAAGFLLFGLNRAMFPSLTDPTWWQSVLLGVAVAGSSIVPGVDSAAIMSAFGLYELYVSSLANFDWQVLLPAAGGLVIGVLVISAVMNLLIKYAYTGTYSVIFGMFIAIIPTVVMHDSCAINTTGQGFTALVFAEMGMLVSLYFSDIKGNNARAIKLFKKIKKK